MATTGIPEDPDFFALVRAFYQERSDLNDYNRLSFVLLGVATPNDLIRDKTRTSFNIGGQCIDLKGFQADEVEPLAAGLGHKVENPSTVMTKILYWTKGQPFLTQRLCKLVAESSFTITLGSEQNLVAQIVQSKIINDWETQDVSVHLKTIRDRILTDEEQSGRLLGLYQRILQAGEVLTDNSNEQIELRLSGLIQTEQNYLRVANPIYEAVFDQAWVDAGLLKLRPYGVAISAWLTSGRQDDSRLLRGQALQDALAWANENRSLGDQDRLFLSASQTIEQIDIQTKLEAQAEANQILSEARQRAETELAIANTQLAETQTETSRLVKKGRRTRQYTTLIATVAITTATIATIWGGQRGLQATIARKEKDIARREIQQFKQETQKLEQEAQSAQQDLIQAETNAITAEQKFWKTSQQVQEIEQDAQAAQEHLEIAQKQLFDVQQQIAQRDQAIIKQEEVLAQLNAAQAFLENEIQNLESKFSKLRAGNVAISRNQTLALLITRPSSIASAIKEIEQLLSEANRLALNAIWPDAPSEDVQVLRINPQIVREIAGNITDGQQYVIRAGILGNYVVGEPCVVHQETPPCVAISLQAKLNRIVFEQGETIARIPIEAAYPSTPSLVEALRTLVTSAQIRASLEGIIIVDNPRVAGGYSEPVVDFLNQVQNYGASLDIEAVAGEQIFTTGPLALELVASHNGKILFQTQIQELD